MRFYKKDITPQIHRLIINLDQLKRKMKRKKKQKESGGNDNKQGREKTNNKKYDNIICITPPNLL